YRRAFHQQDRSCARKPKVEPPRLEQLRLTLPRGPGFVPIFLLARKAVAIARSLGRPEDLRKGCARRSESPVLVEPNLARKPSQPGNSDRSFLPLLYAGQPPYSALRQGPRVL